jgi:phenylalanyl-tRNA synthetase beta chain
MQISYNWLKRHLPFQLTPTDLAEILTNTGLEVEEIVHWESIKGGLNEVVIGEIVSCEQHPDADKLKVTKVNVGEPELLQIVCGAPNCRVGLKSPVAKIGAVLFPTGATDAFAIKKSKIRGVESFGMICADDELGLGSSHDGIMELPSETPIGLRAADYFGVEQDYIISIGLTPNRSDAFSHVGVARDLKAALAAVFNIELDWTSHPFDFNATIDSPISVTIENQIACKRYSSVYLKGVKVTTSPLWLQNKLKAIGVKPINSIVDVTNFVLHETGQPLHAFDANKIANQKIVVKTGGYEVMTTLDHVERKLTYR